MKKLVTNKSFYFCYTMWCVLLFHNKNNKGYNIAVMQLVFLLHSFDCDKQIEFRLRFENQTTTKITEKSQLN